MYELCKDYLKLPNVESDSFRIGETVKKIEKIMEQRYESKERNASGIFLVIDEFAALRIALGKKEFTEINDSLRRIILMGRAANIHIIMSLQRPETSVLDGAIRDNYPVRIGLGNLKDENFKMVFGITKMIQSFIKKLVKVIFQSMMFWIVLNLRGFIFLGTRKKMRRNLRSRETGLL